MPKARSGPVKSESRPQLRQVFGITFMAGQILKGCRIAEASYEQMPRRFSHGLLPFSFSSKMEPRSHCASSDTLRPATRTGRRRRPRRRPRPTPRPRYEYGGASSQTSRKPVAPPPGPPEPRLRNLLFRRPRRQRRALPCRWLRQCSGTRTLRAPLSLPPAPSRRPVSASRHSRPSAGPQPRTTSPHSRWVAWRTFLSSGHGRKRVPLAERLVPRPRRRGRRPRAPPRRREIRHSGAAYHGRRDELRPADAHRDRCPRRADRRHGDPLDVADHRGRCGNWRATAVPRVSGAVLLTSSTALLSFGPATIDVLVVNKQRST